MSAPNRLLDLADLELPEFRRVSEEIDRLLAEYPGLYVHPGKRWEYPWSLARAGLSPGMQVLDIGCGRSAFPALLAGRGVRVWAVDRDLPPPGEQPARVRYVAADLTRLPFPFDAFDAVFCLSVIEHLPREAMPNALSEMRRVLRPSGRLLLTTDYAENAAAEMWYDGPGERFRVDWSVFDERLLREYILAASGFAVDGPVDLAADWARVAPAMRRYHGYPYTAVGVALTPTCGAREAVIMPPDLSGRHPTPT